MAYTYTSEDYKNMQKRYVYGVRIFLVNGYKPMAELMFGDGGKPNGETEIIEWDVTSERDRFIINAYTYIWDERPTVKDYTFKQYIREFNPDKKFDN